VCHEGFEASVAGVDEVLQEDSILRSESIAAHAFWSGAGNLICVREFRSVAAVSTGPICVCVASLIGLEADVGRPIERYHESEISDRVVTLTAACNVTLRPDLTRADGWADSQGRHNEHY
jgi:hypothetical protein